jgi:hypothetical protein
MNLTIQLTRHDGAPTTGILDIGEGVHSYRHVLNSWRQGGDPGHINATTDVGKQVTIALDRREDGTRWGHMTIGEDGYDLDGVVVDGLTITGTAEHSKPDAWLEAYVARLTRAVSG